MNTGILKSVFQDDPEITAYLSQRETEDRIRELEATISEITLTPGPQGIRGSLFLGCFANFDELPSAEGFQQGDFAVVDGVIWYIV